MGLVATSLSAAVTATDTAIVVASATSVAAGRLIRVDGETMRVQSGYTSGTTVDVLRGLDGTVTAAHQASAIVVHGAADDFDTDPDGVADAVMVPAARARRIRSYTAAGAITLPKAGEDMVAVINGTSTIAMTVALPPVDIDGSILYIFGNAKSASTVTFASGVGNAGASYDVITLQNAGNVGVMAIALNGFWNIPSAPAITGTTTAIGVAVA